ncbi:phosphoribosyltransferase-like protein [Gaertneriomyces semiglobifer]|nr:phosphoribosyltransferase-like protein [Gaertneriomyces semiglobifer]
MRGITVLAGSSHPGLAQSIVERLGIKLGSSKSSKFSNKESNVEIGESVREQDVYIIQSGCGNVNDNFMELLIMIAACKTASAKKVTAVIPCFPYARQPETPYKKSGIPAPRMPPQDVSKINNLYDGQLQDTRGPESPSSEVPNGIPTPLSPTSKSLSVMSFPDEVPAEDNTPLATPKVKHQRTESTSVQGLRGISTISRSQSNVEVHPLVPQLPATSGVSNTSGYRHWSARCGTLIANMLMAAGADHIITMDLHDPQFQGFFDIPVDDLRGQPLMMKYIKEKVPDYKKAVIVSPDAGGAKRATAIADKLNMDFALIHKERRVAAGSELILVGDVKDRVCILIDDIVDTSFTITRAAALLTQSGATRIYSLITHGILSGDAIERIKNSTIDEVVVSNSVPQEEHLANLPGRLTTFDISGVFAEAIRRIHNGESVSFLFEQTPY